LKDYGRFLSKLKQINAEQNAEHSGQKQHKTALKVFCIELLSD
jgi:hypothetical protein